MYIQTIIQIFNVTTFVYKQSFMDENKKIVLKEFQKIPGVGKSIAEDLWNLGFRSLEELKTQSPEKMYDDFCSLVNQKVDRCLLYVFRGAVYFVSNEKHEPELLKWWNWKF